MQVRSRAPGLIAIHVNVNIQVDTLALPWKGAANSR